MTLTATIKDSGDDVVCVHEKAGKRDTFRVSLKDFIASISAINNDVECEYREPIGEIPEDVVSLRLAKDSLLFSAKILIKRKAGPVFYNYGGNVFKVPMPELLFDLHIKEGQVDTARTKIYAVNGNKELCAYPYTNVYADAHICWGSLRIPKVANVKDSVKILDFFLAAENNSDLTQNFSLEAMGVATTHALLMDMKKEKIFKDEWLKPLGGITIDALI